MTICLVTAVLFLVLSLFLFRGKGAWLIAGFNTLSEQEKQQYDVPKLCRAVGGICLVCSVMLCAMAYFGHRVDSGRMEESGMLAFSGVFIVVILAAILFAGIYIHKKTKK